jgi:hypothetical protein
MSLYTINTPSERETQERLAEVFVYLQLDKKRRKPRVKSAKRSQFFFFPQRTDGGVGNEEGQTKRGAGTLSKSMFEKGQLKGFLFAF